MVDINTVKTIRQCGGHVVHTNDGHTWIFDNNTQKISIIDQRFKIVETADFDCKLEDVTLSNDNDILATSKSLKSIVRISTSQGTTTLKSLPSKPLGGLCVNTKQEIVVGWGFSLMVYSSDASTTIGTIEIDETNQPLFIAWVGLVRQTIHEEYVVTSAYEVICFTNDWILKWRCKLANEVLGLCCDRFNNVLVVQRLRSELIVINCKNGKILHTAGLPNVEIFKPLSLSVDKNGLLWIGQESKTTVVSYIL